MARKNFTQFENVQIPSTSDYVVGFKGDESNELKTTVQNILNLVPPPVLTYNENTYELRALGLSGSNSITLSGLNIVNQNGEITIGSNNTPALTAETSGGAVGYIVVKLNGTLFKLPLHVY